MSQPLLKINKSIFPYRLEIYIYFLIVILFIGYSFIYKNIFFWLVFSFMFFIIHNILTAHFWEFHSDRLVIKFKYFKKKEIHLAYGTFSLVGSIGSMHSGHYKIIIKKNKVNTFYSPYWMWYSNPDTKSIRKICEIARERKIELKGNW